MAKYLSTKEWLEHFKITDEDINKYEKVRTGSALGIKINKETNRKRSDILRLRKTDVPFKEIAKKYNNSIPYIRNLAQSTMWEIHWLKFDEKI